MQDDGGGAGGVANPIKRRGSMKDVEELSLATMLNGAVIERVAAAARPKACRKCGVLIYVR